MPNHAKGETVMEGMTDRFIKWCARDTASARFQRSVAQGVIGVASGLLSAAATNDPVVGTIVAPLVMCVLSPVMKAIGNNGEVE